MRRLFFLPSRSSANEASQVRIAVYPISNLALVKINNHQMKLVVV